MKGKRTQIIILLLLAIFVGYLIISNQNSTIKSNVRNFAIEDTASINKFYLVDKNNNGILLERQQGFWTVNGEDKARQGMVALLLKTLNRIRVKEPVSKSVRDSIVESFTIESTKVEIYKNNKLLKVIYVGEPTVDLYGTYMILENSSQPFIMEMPSFRGYLSTRFSTNIADWKMQSVFSVKLNNIKQVTVNNIMNKPESFKVLHNGNNFELFDYSNNKIEKFDTVAIAKFFMEFENKTFKKYVDSISKKVQDSILQSRPMYIILVEDIKEHKRWIKAYSKPAWGKIDFFGSELKSDPDTFFMLLSSNDFVYADYVNYNPIFKDISDFKMY